MRNGKRTTVTAVVGERPSEDKLAQFGAGPDEDFSQPGDSDSEQAATQDLGLTVQALTPSIVRQLGLPATTRGVVIAAVDQESDAGAKGLRRGDVLISANNKPTTNEAELNAAVREVKQSGRSAILLQVLRRGQQPAFIPIRLRDK
ncbi:MAG: hypothetical protein B7Z20_11180 [Sphingobium sp. 32-64-5]|nr:MAG: hypothetical protein B7Z20_11180 [Sphingobium sp. 32-64-5]